MTVTGPATGHAVPLPQSLRGAHVVVLGGSAGIGAAAVRLLADVGASVTAASRSGARPDGVRDDADVRTEAVDVVDEAGLQSLAERLGRVDHVLVTAAQIRGGLVAQTSYDDVAGTIAGWVRGAYNVGRVFGPRIGAGGSVTFVSGVSVVRPQPGLAAPAAAAGGIEALARVLAVELAPVRVNTLRFASTDTGLLRRLLGGADDATVAGMGAVLPLGRVARPEEAAAAALFVMANPYVSGTVVTVDGAASLA
jgi:NAD(P)-dependent dehydrogenase (short-subunit alcohol dehydrogenase family)